MTPRRAYVDGAYGQIHVRIARSDKPHTPALYCLHQSPKSGLEFERFAEHASADRDVIAPDYPGYGLSDPPPNQSAATIEMYAREMWRVADQLGHTRVDLFGNHTGSKVAVAMAVAAPQRVRDIVLISAPILTDAERDAFIEYFKPIELDLAGTRFRTMWERIVRHSGPGVTLEMMASSFMQNQLGGEAYEWGHAAAFAYGAPFEDALRELDHRILVLNPADDLQIATRRAAHTLKNGEVKELPDWGHGFLDAYPSEVCKLVTQFLGRTRT